MSDHRLASKQQLCRGVRVGAPTLLCRNGQHESQPDILFVASTRRLAKTLGQAGEIEPETEGILMEHDVDFSDFSNEVLECLPKNLPWSIPPEELSTRKDLR